MQLLLERQEERIIEYSFQSFSFNEEQILFSEISLNDSEYEYLDSQVMIQNEQELQFKQEFIDVVRIINFEEVKVFIDELICPICSHVLVDPRICQECSQGFCKQCISIWYKGKKKSCPCCRSLSNQKSNGTQPPKLLLKLLSKLKLSCIYQDNGCKEVINYDNREKHFESYCQYKFIICQYCFCKILQIDSQTHQSNCNFRPIKCMWCSQIFSYNDHLNHSDICSFRMFKCIQCLKEVPYSQINIHTPIQCQKQQLKKQKNEHLESKSEIDKLKAKLLGKIKKIKKLERFIKKQKQQNQEEYTIEQKINDDNSIGELFQLEKQIQQDDNQFEHQQGIKLVNQNKDYQDFNLEEYQLQREQEVDKEKNTIIRNQEQKSI